MFLVPLIKINNAVIITGIFMRILKNQKQFTLKLKV